MAGLDFSPAPARAGGNYLPILAPSVVLCVIVLHLLATGRQVAAQEPLVEMPDRSIGVLQRLVDDLKAGLAIPQAVAVNVVSGNRRALSVSAPATIDGPFRLSVDETFVGALSDDELAAALAHELGHVWVFTHHPYLQTERLANEVAMRVVSRESLERLYTKVWAHGGMKGDMLTFLGPTPVMIESPLPVSADASH